MLYHISKINSSIRFYRLITKIFEEAKNKSPVVRAKVAIYFLVILLSYPEDIIEKQLILIEEYLNISLGDAKPEVRLNARMCFIRYKEIFPQRAK